MRTTLDVDHRAHLATSGLGDELLAELRKAFTYNNPKFYGMRAIGKSTRGISPVLRTFEERRGEMTFARGALKRVRLLLEKHGHDVRFHDRRASGDLDVGASMPDHLLELRSYQRDVVNAAVAKENCLIRSPTGCLTGDTVVGLNRAGKGFSARLDYVVSMFNGGRSSGRVWEDHIPTFIRAPMGDGSVRLCPLVGARESGAKPVYELFLSSGHRLKATACHRFLTPFGWCRLDDMLLGDFLFVDGGLGVASQLRKRKPWYRLRTCRKHPFAGRRGVDSGKGGWTVPEHRLVAEARENGISLEEFLVAVDEERSGLRFLDPARWVVHHRDQNHRNNDPSNLEVLSYAEHRCEHREDSIRNITAFLEPVTLDDVEYVGDEPTYDLEVERAEAFMANGIAVHNSGKTTAAFNLAGRLKTPMLVLVRTSGLFEQWVTRAKRELGIDERDVGIITGKKRVLKPLTVAMQQTLFAHGIDDALKRYFGAVLVDEVQNAAAETVYRIVDQFPARYRYGVSDDERRKDKLDFLIYDLFGEVAHEVDREQLVTDGYVLDVEVRVVPTTFRADWYGVPDSGVAEFGGEMPKAGQTKVDIARLYAEMMSDTKREAIVQRILDQELKAGSRIAVFSHRREHCLAIDRSLVARGVATGFLLGGAENKKEFRRTIERLTSGEARVGVGTYQALGTGIDLPALNVGIATTPIASNQQFFRQVRGRLCRPQAGKQARFYLLWDRHVFPRHLDNLIAWSRTVRVLHGTRWVDAAEYRRRSR